MNFRKITDWLLRILPAAILLQTLYFKFTGAPESIAIFSQLGIEPWGRYLIGTLELICAIALLIPTTAAPGAVLTLLIMLGAIGSHLTKLGIVIAGDGGLLFTLALIVALCSAVVVWIRRAQLQVAAISVLATLKQ